LHVSIAYEFRRELIEMRYPEWQVTRIILVAFLFCLLLACATASGTPGYAIYVPEDSTSARALTDLLHDREHRAVQVSDLKEALESNAGVLVLWLPGRDVSSVDTATLNALRKRRVIAIGYGAAMLFERLGLEVNGRACAHNPSDPSPRIRLEQNSLVDKEMAQREIVAFRLPPDMSPNADYDFAMYIPAKSHLRSVVEVIGRWSHNHRGSGNYAPIVRQGNYLMVGFAAPVEAWTAEYKNLFRELAISVLRREPQPFPAVKWDATRPEVYEFKLAKSGSTTDLQDKTFYFSFKKPTAFTAKLDTRGSSDVMLLFVGKYREHWTRKDAGLNQQTKVAVQISEEDVQSSGEGHWKLTISNFDAEHEAQCTLTIAY